MLPQTQPERSFIGERHTLAQRRQSSAALDRGNVAALSFAS